MIIFTKEELTAMSAKQLTNLRKYYKIEKMAKKDLVDILYTKINIVEPNPEEENGTAIVYDENGIEIPMSIQVRRAYWWKKKHPEG